jgi:hypothetical protein
MAQQVGQTIGQGVADAIVPGVIAAAGDRDRVQSERAAGRVSVDGGQPPRPARWCGPPR